MNNSDGRGTSKVSLDIFELLYAHKRLMGQMPLTRHRQDNSSDFCVVSKDCCHHSCLSSVSPSGPVAHIVPVKSTWSCQCENYLCTLKNTVPLWGHGYFTQTKQRPLMDKQINVKKRSGKTVVKMFTLNYWAMLFPLLHCFHLFYALPKKKKSWSPQEWQFLALWNKHCEITLESILSSPKWGAPIVLHISFIENGAIN